MMTQSISLYDRIRPRAADPLNHSASGLRSVVASMTCAISRWITLDTPICDEAGQIRVPVQLLGGVPFRDGQGTNIGNKLKRLFCKSNHLLFIYFPIVF